MGSSIHTSIAARSADSHPSDGVVLLVDDNAINRTLLAAQLAHRGYTFRIAEHGGRALEILRTQLIDVVLLDLMMPEIDGYEILRRIRADEQLRHIPVIVISALGELDSIVRCIELGATDYLIRPYEPTLLQARLRASLASRRLREKEAALARDVQHLAALAAEVEGGTFVLDQLRPMAERSDAIGHLSRVLLQMAGEVESRERRLRQQSEFKTALIGRISHELRSPFVSAGFTVQLLQRYAERGMYTELQAELPQLEQHIGFGRQMIDGILTYAALASKLSHPYLEPVAMAPLIEAVSAPLEVMAHSRGIQMSVRCAELTPIAADREQISEAIHHLLHNALKFTPAGGQVNLACWQADGWLLLTVEDTGCGVEPPHLDAIWDAFAQEADDVRRGVAGLGLGLALVKCIVDAHRGHVLATSTLGEGSLFGFRIPMASDTTA